MSTFEKPQSVRELDVRYLRCRATFHRWVWRTDEYPIVSHAGYYQQVDVCAGCEMVRSSTISTRTNQRVETPSYTNRPKGFGSNVTGEPFTREMCQIEWRRRVRNGLVPPSLLAA